jgi:hypothetical protein
MNAAQSSRAKTPSSKGRKEEKKMMFVALLGDLCPFASWRASDVVGMNWVLDA